MFNEPIKLKDTELFFLCILPDNDFLTLPDSGILRLIGEAKASALSAAAFEEFGLEVTVHDISTRTDLLTAIRNLRRRLVSARSNL